MRIEVSSLLFSLSTALDYVEEEIVGVTTNHCRRVACVSMQICKHLGMSAADTMDMAICAILHDSALTEMFIENTKNDAQGEFALHKHCNFGEQNVKNFPFFQGNAENIVLWHHENWDGSGYFKLKGHEISDRAAILRLADNTDLRFALGKNNEESREKFFKHILENKGKIYAPHIVDALFECIDEDFLISIQDENIENTIKTMIAPKIEEFCIKDVLKLGCVFSNIIDSKSEFTANHSQGIVRLAEIMGNFYNFNEEHIGILMLSAHLHDIGKLMVPLPILEKNGPLDDDEFSIMKSHAQATYNMLSTVQGFETICIWASSHHEKLDGTGYPMQKNKMHMPFEARLLVCIDIYQALTEDRPYRQGMSHTKAMAVLMDLVNQGKVEASIVEDMEEVMQSQAARDFVHKNCRNAKEELKKQSYL